MQAPSGRQRPPTAQKPEPTADPTALWTPPLAEPKNRRPRTAAGATAPARDAKAPAGAPKPAAKKGFRSTAIIIAAVVAVVLVAGAVGGYLLLGSDSPKNNAPASKKADTPAPKDISTRDVDQAPLTQQELFPTPQITVGTNNYQVLKGEDGGCDTAATDDLAALLGQAGCSQVVRATLKSPDGQFLVTAGIFNLKDKASADQAFNGIKPIVDAQKGRFSGLAAGDGTDAIVRAPTTLGWQPEGHFLAYCIVARTDSKPIPADDGPSKQLITDIVESHLRDKVIEARTVSPTNPPAK
jgi:hypothetical protein